MVTLAQTLGTLSLVLNSVRDGGDDDRRQAGQDRGGEPRRGRCPRSSRRPRRRGGRAADARVRRDLDQPRCRSCAACDPRHGRRPATRRRGRRRPHRISPHQTGMRAVKRHRPLAVALAAAFVTLSGQLAGPARRLRAGAAARPSKSVEPRGRHRPADPGRRGVLQPLRRQPRGGRRRGEVAAADVPDRRRRRRDDALRGGRATTTC